MFINGFWVTNSDVKAINLLNNSNVFAYGYIQAINTNAFHLSDV